MPIARYFIVHDPAREEWRIQFRDDEFGPYRSKDEATVFAIDAAEKLSSYGGIAEVCLMGENGHYLTEWSSVKPAPEAEQATAA